MSKVTQTQHVISKSLKTVQITQENCQTEPNSFETPTASDRNKWRKIINQGAAKYQKAWEEKRLAKSLIRKQK